MESILQDRIIKEAIKHAERFQSYHNAMELEYQRNTRRIQFPPPKEVKLPACWEIDKKFNPFYVIKHHKQIAHSITKKILEGTYKPFDPYIQEVKKKDGGMRKVTIYQIPDAAVSNYFYQRLLSKNKHRFSSLSYAYRNDRNVHYAIQDIAIELRQNSRLFVSEFDFKDFFGSINHKYMESQLDENGFLISNFEKMIIKAFIEKNERGVPQGTSISLFLANLVCWKLDRRLEAEGLRFARYADDTIIWSRDYSKICKSFDIISDFSKEAGIDINFKKSEGISLMVKEGLNSEMFKSKNHINFLGYKISLDNVAIKDASVNKIKKEISYLLYRNLIQPIKPYPLRAVTIPINNEDSDFVTAIMQIRRYLYGNLNEDKLRKYLNGAYKKLNFKGVMSFYPLIDHERQLKELDGWLVYTILQSLRLREKILTRRGLKVTGKFPFNMTKDDILEVCRRKVIKDKKGLIEIPSFLRIYEAIKKGLLSHGIDKTMNPSSDFYDY